MTIQSYLLLAVAAILAVAWVLLLMRPGHIRKTATPKPQSMGTMSIGLECDSAPALAELRKVTAALERIADLQERIAAAGGPPLRLEVKEQRHRTPERRARDKASARKR